MTLWRHDDIMETFLARDFDPSRQTPNFTTTLEIGPDPYSPHMSRVLPFDSACDSNSNGILLASVRALVFEKIAKTLENSQV